MTTSADHSAGILLYRRDPVLGLEVFIGHMGGPFWARKDNAAWSVPKGLIEPGEDEFAAALREFGEEIGVPAPDAEYAKLGDFVYTSGKVVTIFAGESDLRVDRVSSMPVTVEWPRGSGTTITFPEIDRAEWCPLDVARTRLVRGQAPALAALERREA
jgi:predicted NUDIX family NTP pyrophosphohydrolase